MANLQGEFAGPFVIAGSRKAPSPGRRGLPQLAGRLALRTAPLALASSLAAQMAPSDFGELYRQLEQGNCRACHNASGVASGTRLRFPPSGATPDEIERFAWDLGTLVDRSDPAQSPLLLKPTNRTLHTGGQLIAPGSDTERLLVAWIERLATASAKPAEPRLDPGAAVRPAEPLRRLTHTQYDNTVRDLLGDRTRPARNFPAEDFVDGFTNQASVQAITPLLAEAYAKAAEKLSRNAFRFGDEHDLIPCEPRHARDRACAEAFVREFGAKAYRRPLEPAEIQGYASRLVAWAAREEDFLAGARLAVETMLQAPQFLFLAPQPEGSPAKQYETASRLAYGLWNAPPDRESLEAAAAGRLGTPADVERQAQRMLAQPAAHDALDGFLAQWMRFDRLRNAVKDRNRFRDYGPEVAESMAEETRLLFRHLVWSDLDFRAFFSADYTFVDDFLTRVYGLPDPETPFGLTRYPESSDRAGILGHGTFLAQTGKPVNTSPTERGLFVREHFLCQTVPPPPPGVDASLPPLALGGRPLTVRELMETLHAAETACASCHKLVDPIGFGFERFDTIGGYRETETVRVKPSPLEERQGRKAETHELPIDSSGYIAGVPDSAFRSPREAGRILAGSSVCQRCVGKQLFRYLFGRHETERDAELLDRAYNRFERSGFRFRELVLGLLVSEEYLQVRWRDAP